MINLNNDNRDLEKLSQLFYNRIETNIRRKILAHKSVLNNFNTDKSGTQLGDFLENKIPELIKSPLEDLMRNFYPELHILCKSNYLTTKKINTPFKTALNSILFYEDQNTWKAYQLAIDLKSDTCSYCNRSYITTLGTDIEKFVRGDFDHFLSKSEYPYLRFSFYNLIPCCVICNRNAKRATDTSLTNNIYPYREGFDNHTVFTYVPKDYNDLIGKGNPDIDFLHLGNDQHNEKSKRNIMLFRLKQQYSIHFQELNDLINKKRVFSNSQLKELQKNYPQLIKNFDDAYLIAFGKEFDLAKDEKRPLSKFTRDIVVELGLISP